MRVLISGGGTGGHINPALAIADKIKKENKDAVIEYVGTKRGLESKLVPKAGYKMHFIRVRGFKRSLSLTNIDAAIKAVTSVIEAKRIIKKFSPDIVIGTGGYVCWPLLKAASRMNIPTCLHEANAYPGVTTRMLAKYVDVIMFGFDESRKYVDCDKSKLFHVGSPVSEKMLSVSRQQARAGIGLKESDRLVLSAGGSLGAKPLNDNVYELIKGYTLGADIYHIHATGNAGWQEEKQRYLSLGFEQKDEDTLVKGKVTVCRYIYNMHELLPACDVEICRAGAMTLSELSLLGRAAVIVPSPYVTNNHQYKNAKVLEDGGAAILIEEKNLSGDLLIETVKELAENDEKRESLERNVRKFAIPDTTERIYSIIQKLLK